MKQLLDFPHYLKNNSIILLFFHFIFHSNLKKDFLLVHFYHPQLIGLYCLIFLNLNSNHFLEELD